MSKRKLLIHELNDRRGALRCDAEWCDYVSPVVHPFTDQLIGLPCPQCGSNLLTRRDYDTAMLELRIVAWINRWFGWLGCTEEQAMKKLTRGKLVVWRSNIHDGKLTTERLK